MCRRLIEWTYEWNVSAKTRGPTWVSFKGSNRSRACTTCVYFVLNIYLPLCNFISLTRNRFHVYSSLFIVGLFRPEDRNYVKPNVCDFQVARYRTLFIRNHVSRYKSDSFKFYLQKYGILKPVGMYCLTYSSICNEYFHYSIFTLIYFVIINGLFFIFVIYILVRIN